VNAQPRRSDRIVGAALLAFADISHRGQIGLRREEDRPSTFNSLLTKKRCEPPSIGFATTIGLRATATAAFPTNFMRCWRLMGGLALPCPRPMGRWPWHHRGRNHDASDRRIRCRHDGRFGGTHEHLRAQSGGCIWDTGAETEDVAAADCREGKGVFCGHRAQRGTRRQGSQRARSVAAIIM
jgi:hypothetical protein